MGTTKTHYALSALKMRKSPIATILRRLNDFAISSFAFELSNPQCANGLPQYAKKQTRRNEFGLNWGEA